MGVHTASPLLAYQSGAFLAFIDKGLPTNWTPFIRAVDLPMIYRRPNCFAYRPFWLSSHDPALRRRDKAVGL